MKEGKVFKRVLAIALVVVMTITMMPFGVFANGETPCEHEYEWVAGVSSTCVVAGASGHYACKKEGCGRVFKNDANKTETTLAELAKPLADHTWNDGAVTTDPTCATKGVKTFTCTVEGCNGTKTEDVEKLTTHTWATEFTVDKAATCTENGSKSKHCTVDGCDEKTEETVINAAHTIVPHDAKAATCTEAGWEAYDTCSKCDYTTKVEIAALDHDWKAATCTEAKKCKREGCTVTEGTPEPHDVEGVKFTKYDDEYHTKKCNLCGGDVSYKKHTFGDAEQTKAPTCEGKGEMTSTCECGAEKKSEIPETDHNWKAGWCDKCGTNCEHDWDGNKCKICKYTCVNHQYDDANCQSEAICYICQNKVADKNPNKHITEETYKKNEKEAKCYDPGYTGDEYYVCCDGLKKAGKEITVDHVYATTLSKKDDATHGKKCTNAGCSAFEAASVDEHEYEIFETLRPATCAKEGEATYKCADCGAVKTDKIAKLTTHTWATEGTTTPATCVAEGKTEYDCTVEGCTEKKEVEIAIVADAHNWETEGEVTKAATCREKGEKTFECTNTGCTKTKKEDIAIVADAHTWNAGTVTKAATCKEKGEKTFECTNTGCTETKKEDIAIDPNAHDITGVAFVKADDKHVKKCKIEGCGAVVVEEAHNYAETNNKTTPTCVTAGKVEMKCAACGDTYEKTLEIDTINGHSWSAWTVTTRPTCTTKGVEERTCAFKLDGQQAHKETRDIEATGHDLVKVPAVAATCQADGVKEHYKCSVCNALFKDAEGKTATSAEAEKIAKGEHSFTTYKYNVGSETCTKEGTETAKCDNCDVTHTRDKVGTMVAHTFKNYVADGNATCIADGTKTAVCEMCKVAKDEVADKDSHKTAPHKPDSTGRKCELCNAELVCTHTYSVDKLITKTATCTTDGQKAIVCSKCKANKPGTEEVIPATGHDWDEGEIIKDATCSEKGSKKLKCNNMCGETTTEEIAVKPHNYKEVITHATCTEAGYSTFTCTMCGSHYVDKAVEAYGHMFETYFYDEGSATCYQDGTKTAECANGCGTKNTVADPGSKTDHEMTDFTVITPATCTEDGEEEAKCFYHEKCGYSEIIPVEALGHDESGEFVETLAATCTTEGSKEKKCARCSVVIATEAIPALGHDETAEFEVTVAPTCTEKGTQVKKCKTCSEVIATEEVAALGHDIAAEYTIDVPATCTTEGSQSKHCSRCDYKDGVVAIPASGHDMQPGEGTTATCTEPGKAVFVCANGCGKTHEEANVPALGHSFTYTSNGDATCQADGTKTGKCIRCDVTETVADEGSMLEHVFGEPVIEKASTEKGGLVTTKCTNCEYEEVEEIAMIDSLKLKYETVVYDGKYKRPSLTITDAEGAKLIKGEDYLLELPEKDECINAGTYTYTVTFIGNYEGEATLTYKVVPGKASKIVSKGTKQTYIDLKWSTVKGADGYRIYVKTSSGGWKKLATVKGKTTYRVKDLKAGTNYTFAVKAFSKAADGETTIWATEFAEQAFKTLPGKTSKLTAKTNKNAVKLTWKEVKGAEGYRVYVKTAKGGWKTVATVKGGKVTYTVKELKANTTYEYAVKAFYKDGSATVWSNQYTTVKAKTAK